MALLTAREAGGRLSYLLPPTCSSNTNKVPVSPRKAFGYISVTPAFMAVTRGGGLDFLAPIVNGACLHRSPRVLANKEAVPNEPESFPTPWLWTSVQRRGSRQKGPSQALPGRDLHYPLPSCCRRVQLPVNLHRVQTASLPIRTKIDPGTAPTTGAH